MRTYKRLKVKDDWEYSSFHRWVKKGSYSENWAAANEICELDFEQYDVNRKNA
jgi:hypothetical protein